MTRAALAAVLAASALILGGCASAAIDDQNVGRDAPVADALDNRTELSCTPGEALLLNSPSTLYTISGPCDDVTIEGNGLIVRAEKVTSLVLRGDGNLIEAATIGSLEMSGQDNTVRADSIDEIEVNGERNEIDD